MIRWPQARPNYVAGPPYRNALLVASVLQDASSAHSTTTLLDPSHEGEDENADEVASTTTTRLDPPLEGEEHDDDDDKDAVLDPEPEGAEDPSAELKRLADENAELRRQLAASTKGGDA